MHRGMLEEFHARDSAFRQTTPAIANPPWSDARTGKNKGDIPYISRRLPGSSDRSETALRHLRSVLGKGLRDQGEKNHR
jgi:hypothetical protein